ncbi:MAG TPA: hypothetical protein VGJ60_20775 [Chloroflexota bacterium]
MSSPDGVDPGYIRWILDPLAAMQRGRSGTPGTTLDNLERRLQAEARDAGGAVCVALAGGAWTRV